MRVHGHVWAPKREPKWSENGPEIDENSISKPNSGLGWKIDLSVLTAGAREGPKSWFSYTIPWLELKTRFFDSMPFWLPYLGLKGSLLAPFWDKMCPKWTSKPCSENVQVLTHVVIDLGIIIASKMSFSWPGPPFGT